MKPKSIYLPTILTDFCGWRNTAQILWLRNTGGNQYSTTKKSPPIDTTTKTPSGWYAMIPAEYLKNYYTATLESPPLYSQSGYNCFSFNYWAVGSNSQTGAFKVRFIDLTKSGIIATVQVNTSTISMWQRFHIS